jgi:methylisocitrate lyase
MNIQGPESRNPAAARLRRLLEEPGMLRIPGVHGGFSAATAQLLGAKAVYVGGGSSTSIDRGTPDMGVIGPGELIAHAGRIADIIDVPVIADLDDGGGTPFRIHHMVTELSHRGIAGFHLEDVDYGKAKHYPGVRGGVHAAYERDAVVPLDQALHRLHAAVDSAAQHGTVVIARTDLAVSSLEAAIERGIAFAEAGADVVFLAHLKIEDTRRAAEALQVPLMNCVLDYEGASAEVCTGMERDGLKILFDHRSVPLAMYRAAWEALVEFRDSGAVRPDDPEIRTVIRDAVAHDTWADRALRYGMLD